METKCPAIFRLTAINVHDRTRNGYYKNPDPEKSSAWKEKLDRFPELKRGNARGYGTPLVRT
jgi:hypothetical protein